MTRLSEEAPATAPHLLRAACRASEDARALAARALRDIGPEAIAALAAALRGADPALRELAREQLAMLLARCEGDPRLIAWSGPRAQAAGPDLAALLSTDDPDLAALAGGALAHLAYGESLSGEVQAALRERAASEGPGARLAAEVLAICAAGIRHNERP